jgi:hypothetical protein
MYAAYNNKWTANEAVAGLGSLTAIIQNLAAVMTVAAIIYSIVAFMRSSLGVTRATSNAEREIDRIKATSQATLETLRRSFVQSTAGATIRVDPSEHAAIVEDATKQVLGAIPGELVTQIRNTFDLEFSKASGLQHAVVALESIARRLADASGEVRERANLNLIMGTVACVLGVLLLLGWVFLFPVPNNEAWQETLVRSIPRISLVLIIELVGYFFLGLYRLGTYELKFFQNELTNVELWTTSYLHAIRTGDHDLINEVVKKLLSVERNFVLRKGEAMAFAPEAKDDEGWRTDLRTMVDVVRTFRKTEGKKE